MKARAFSDASYVDGEGVAGIGIVLDKGLKTTLVSNWIPCCDVNYAELFAIYVAGILLGGEGTVYTDSQAAVEYINGNITDERPRTKEQYIRHQQKKVLAYKIRKLNLEIVKVKGHSKEFNMIDLNNNEADLQARKGVAKYRLVADKMFER